MKDAVQDKAELIIDALQYAHDHDLDVNKKEDVLKILEVLDPEHKEDIDEFMNLLQTSDAFLDMQAKSNENIKPKLPN